MKTKPRGIHANFTTECATCRGELTVSNGRIEHHECRTTAPMTVWATHEEVAECQAFQSDVLARLEAAFDGR